MRLFGLLASAFLLSGCVIAAETGPVYGYGYGYPRPYYAPAPVYRPPVIYRPAPVYRPYYGPAYRPYAYGPPRRAGRPPGWGRPHRRDYRRW
ncbi:hypothetical protein DFH01_13990 [Falsiroseomonas bella]|uniref:Lipoprotein n=1 Tax=Falsiroseomonas bella TaxID=2184016 RepID=A0A317FFF1_9PROT|nr:hypothetical protein DFH01_13990 [Falsiroseomonas bella]